jgi:hypothetical protein
MSRCAASYGPNGEQPIVLLTQVFAEASRWEGENTIDTFDTY